MKICVYAICKNEENFVPRFCNSAADADLILIADTGSTDGSSEAATQCGATVHHLSINPWRFDVARNAALALVPGDVDVCVSLDMDEILLPGWREEIERLWQIGSTTNMCFLFDCGNGSIFRPRRIHARHGYSWRHPCHELLVLDNRLPLVEVSTDKLLMRHLPDNNKSRGQYLDILGVAVRENPECPRNAFYYARELGYQARWQECADAFWRYLNLPADKWYHERGYAYRAMGRAYSFLGNVVEAEKAFRMATVETPYIRESWNELSEFMYKHHRWVECHANAMIGLGISYNEPVHTSDPSVWGWKLHDLAAISAHYLGMTETAVQQGQIAVNLAPNDERLCANLRYYLAAQTPTAD
jgi:glycosyltransferase involved in cell wall biosynthesis